VALCAGLVVVAVLVVARPELLAHNAVTKALGAPALPLSTTSTTDPSPATTTTTTTTSSTTTTTVPVTPVTTPTEDPTPTTVPEPVAVPTTVVPPEVTVPSVPSYRAPVIATTVEPGSFGAVAEVVSATYPITTTGGVVSVTGSWSGAVTLTLFVQCTRASPNSATGPSGLSVSAVCPAGAATVGASEATTATVSYSLTIRFPSASGS